MTLEDVIHAALEREPLTYAGGVVEVLSVRHPGEADVWDPERGTQTVDVSELEPA